MLEQLSLLQKAVLEDAISEVVTHFDLFLIDKAVSYSYDGLLHFFGEFNSFLKQNNVVLTEVEGVVGNPEVVVETAMHAGDAAFLSLSGVSLGT